MVMNILYLTPWFPTDKNDFCGGFVPDSITALEELGVTSQVAVTKSWKPGQTFQPQINTNIHAFRYLSIPRYYLRFLSNWSYILRLSSSIAQLVKQYDIQLINAHTELCGIVATRVGKCLNIPVVVTIHGIETCSRMWIGAAGKMVDATLDQASRVVVVGKNLLDYFQRRFIRVDHFRIIHNGFRLYPDMLNFSERKEWPTNISIISVSNLQEGKGIDITIRALFLLKKLKFDRWRYTIVGDGPEKKALRNLVNKLNLNEHIVFTGACEHEKVCQYLKSAHVFCLPSYREAFGIAYLEAMAYGLLTIGVAGEGPEAFIKHGETGLLVKPRDVNELFKTLKEVMERHGIMQEIARQGRACVLQQFTWQKHAESLLKVYQEILPYQ